MAGKNTNTNNNSNSERTSFGKRNMRISIDENGYGVIRFDARRVLGHSKSRKTQLIVNSGGFALTEIELSGRFNGQEVKANVCIAVDCPDWVAPSGD